MALKTLMLRKKIDDATKAIETMREAEAELEKREAELEEAIREAETEEEKAACEDEVEKFEAEKAEHVERKQGLEKDLADLEAELAEEEARSDKAVEEERKDKPEMEVREKFTETEMQERAAFADYVRGIQTRDDYNMTQGNNGAVVPKTIANEIITKVKEICPIFEQATKYPVKGTLEVPYYPYSSSHVIAAAYASEMSALTAASGDIGSVEMTGFVAGALAKISKKLINNTDIDVVPFIVDQMAEAFKAFYEHECLVGTNNKATGLLAGIDSDATVTGTYKSSVTADDLIDCQCKVPTALQGNCCWIMAPATFNQVRKLKDEENRYLLANDYREGFGYTLLGKPVYLSENMPALGTSDNKAVVYGDFSGLGVKLAEELEIQVLEEAFATVHAVGVIGWTEIDTKVVNAQKFACIKCGSSDPQ